MAGGSALAQLKRADELLAGGVAQGAGMLPVLSPLRDLLPWPGLRRGSTVAVTRGGSPGATSVMLALIAEASRAGAWCAVVGLPELGLGAAQELGIALDRLALVPHPGPRWTDVVSILLDGFDIVVVAAGNSAGEIAPAVQSRLEARARARGSVLVPFGAWNRPQATLWPERSVWHGLGRGGGRLRWRELVICARSKGPPRRATLWLPGPARTI